MTKSEGYATKATTNESDLANAFNAQCHVTSSGLDWYVDSGATDHMTSSLANVNNTTPYMGQANATFGNGNKLPVSHIGHNMVNNNIRLRDVLVVPNLTKNLLSISKLTSDNLLDVLFLQPYFYIQDRLTKQVLAQGRCENTEYGRKFKGYCDQLAAVGHPVDPSDQVHWFLYGLRPSFETFSTSIRTSRQTSMFRDLLALRGRGRRPPHCQLCRTKGHYANKCPDLPQYATKATTNESDLANAFHAQCHVTSLSLDWYVDSEATDHMTSSLENVNNTTPNIGQANVTFDPNLLGANYTICADTPERCFHFLHGIAGWIGDGIISPIIGDHDPYYHVPSMVWRQLYSFFSIIYRDTFDNALSVVVGSEMGCIGFDCRGSSLDGADDPALFIEGGLYVGLDVGESETSVTHEFPQESSTKTCSEKGTESLEPCPWDLFKAVDCLVQETNMIGEARISKA
nr:putative zinc finger, CCHC-type [Tanacetum cinerariifolium]